MPTGLNGEQWSQAFILAWAGNVTTGRSDFAYVMVYWHEKAVVRAFLVRLPVYVGYVPVT